MPSRSPSRLPSRSPSRSRRVSPFALKSAENQAIQTAKSKLPKGMIDKVLRQGAYNNTQRNLILHSMIVGANPVFTNKNFTFAQFKLLSPREKINYRFNTNLKKTPRRK